jgi:hypothetical protein
MIDTCRKKAPPPTTGKGGFIAQAANKANLNQQQPVQQPVQQSLTPLPEAVNTNWSNAPQPMGKGGVQTNSATSGQPRMGQQNQYSNTVGQWDNTQQQTQQPRFGGGKGKG